MITIRQPKFDFSKSRPRWAPEWEFAIMFNAQSLLFPPLERYLNRVMAMAAKTIKGNASEDVELRSEIAKFITQEGQHYTIHTAYNVMLEKGGLTKLPEFEAQMDEEYRVLLKDKSLKFLTAYCDGFETLGPIFARIYLDKLEEYFAGADPEIVAMWKWHLLEEFEHRNVCFDVYDRVHGGYFYRIYGMIYAHRHMGAYMTRVTDYMFEHEYQTMSEEEIAASKARLKKIRKKMGRMALPQILKIFLPNYSPHNSAEPAGYKAFVAELDRRFAAA